MPLTPDAVLKASPAYIEEQYRRFRQDPASVSPDWAAFFAGFELAAARPPGGGPAAGEVSGLVHHFRAHGHLYAHLDPLSEPPPPPDPVSLGFTSQELDRPVTGPPIHGEFHGTVHDLIGALRRTYADTVGVEFMHLDDEERRIWLEECMEPVRNHPV